jgi:hypothetical protein
VRSSVIKKYPATAKISHATRNRIPFAATSTPPVPASIPPHQNLPQPAEMPAPRPYTAPQAPTTPARARKTALTASRCSAHPVPAAPQTPPETMTHPAAQMPHPHASPTAQTQRRAEKNPHSIPAKSNTPESASGTRGPELAKSPAFIRTVSTRGASRVPAEGQSLPVPQEVADLGEEFFLGSRSRGRSRGGLA